MISLLIAIFAGALIYFVIRLALDGAQLMGEAEERAREAARDAETARKQAEVMGEDRTEDDAADRLDSGTF